MIDFFDVATSQMEAPYLSKTPTEDDFVEVVHKLVKMNSKESWTFVGLLYFIYIRWTYKNIVGILFRAHN